MSEHVQEVVKPRLRGLSHLVAAVAAVLAGVPLIDQAPGGRGRVAASVYVATLVLMFGASALYHVPHWGPAMRRWLRRVDHSAIFVFIAGTYTPFCLLLPAPVDRQVLALVWGGALLGVLKAMFFVYAPRAITAALYLLLGWVMLPFLRTFHAALGAGPLALIALGGVAYTAGALVYARKRPDPVPHVFGYHEVFHVLVIAAAVLHFGAVLRVVPRLGG